MKDKLKLFAEPDRHDIVMTREFRAPRALVFRALTEPALVARWWGPEGYTTTIEAMDVRMGGIWRYLQHGTGGEFRFSGVYHHIKAPEQIVYTFEFEGSPGHVLLETITLAEDGGMTTLTDSLVFQSVADRDAMIAAGMESGTADSWNRMEDILAAL